MAGPPLPASRALYRRSGHDSSACLPGSRNAGGRFKGQQMRFKVKPSPHAIGRAREATKAGARNDPVAWCKQGLRVGSHGRARGARRGGASGHRGKLGIGPRVSGLYAAAGFPARAVEGGAVWEIRWRRSCVAAEHGREPPRDVWKQPTIFLSVGAGQFLNIKGRRDVSSSIASEQDVTCGCVNTSPLGGSLSGAVGGHGTVFEPAVGLGSQRRHRPAKP